MTGTPIGAAGNATGDDAEQRVADWTASISARAAAARELSERVAGMTATASGGGGEAEVTVAGSGVLSDLRLDDRVLTWSADSVDQARAAGATAKLGRDAYGKLCPLVPTLIDPVQQLGIDALQEAVTTLQDTADRLRTAAGEYTGSDQSASDSFTLGDGTYLV